MLVPPSLGADEEDDDVEVMFAKTAPADEERPEAMAATTQATANPADATSGGADEWAEDHLTPESGAEPAAESGSPESGHAEAGRPCSRPPT